MNLYHPTPLQQRQPIDGRLPMTTYEWLHTPPHCRNSSDTTNPHILMVENTSTRIIPVLLVEDATLITEAGHA